MDPFLGEIRMVGFNFAPTGWALCNGQQLGISQYQALFALLGTTYGGNGTTNFNLPDLQGRFPLHAGSGAGLPVYAEGQKAGSPTVTLLSTQMPAHTHVATFTPASGGSSSLQTSSAAANSASPAGNYLGNSLDPGGTVPNTLQNYVTPAAAAGKLGAVAGLSVTGGGGTVTNALTGGSQPLTVQNAYLAVNFIIALQGIFPSRN